MRVLHRIECDVCLKHKLIETKAAAIAQLAAVRAGWVLNSDGTEMCARCARPATVSPGQVAS